MYKRTVQDSSVRYERFKPLKLADADGLIARHVKTLRSGETVSWRLDAATLTAIAGSEAGGKDGAVLFDLGGGDPKSVCLYELTCIHGSCSDLTTQLALDFIVVLYREIGDEASDFARSFVAPLPESPKRLAEMLALSGGPGGGDWKWTASGMNLGATVVQPQAHGKGEPCPNRSCDRRAATP